MPTALDPSGMKCSSVPDMMDSLTSVMFSSFLPLITFPISTICAEISAFPPDSFIYWGVFCFAVDVMWTEWATRGYLIKLDNQDVFFSKLRQYQQWYFSIHVVFFCCCCHVSVMRIWKAFSASLGEYECIPRGLTRVHKQWIIKRKTCLEPSLFIISFHLCIMYTQGILEDHFIFGFISDS